MHIRSPLARMATCSQGAYWCGKCAWQRAACAVATVSLVLPWLKTEGLSHGARPAARMPKRRTRTASRSADRHIKRVCVTLDCWLRSTLNLPEHPDYQQPQPVDQLTAINYLEQVQLESRDALSSCVFKTWHYNTTV